MLSLDDKLHNVYYIFKIKSLQFNFLTYIFKFHTFDSEFTVIFIQKFNIIFITWNLHKSLKQQLSHLISFISDASCVIETKIKFFVISEESTISRHLILQSRDFGCLRIFIKWKALFQGSNAFYASSSFWNNFQLVVLAVLCH